MSRVAEPFDRLTGCETLESSERRDRLQDAAPWPWVCLEAWGHKYRVLAAELWDKEPKVQRIYDDGTVSLRVADCRAVLVVEALRARETEERQALEHEQTDARAIAWLRERGRLIEREDGSWVLA